MSQTPAEEPAPKSDASPPTESPAPADAAPAETDATPQPATTGNRPWALLLVLLLIAAIGSGGYFLWRTQQTLAARLAELQSSQAERLTRLDQTLTRLQERNQQLEQSLTSVSQAQQELAKALADLLRRSRHLQKEWLVAEADYLVRLASQRLALARDVNTALAALRAADRRLREIGDPAILPVRKALAEDIDALEKVPMPDITGLALRLGALIKGVDALPLLTPRPETAQTTTETPPDGAPVKHWRELPAAMWEDVKKLIVIRQHQGPIKPLMTPEQHFFLVQNLKLQLEQARLALLQGQADLWRDSLDTARRWLTEWFDPEDARTAHLRTALEELARIEVNPRLPDLARSHAALGEYLAQQAEGATDGKAAR